MTGFVELKDRFQVTETLQAWASDSTFDTMMHVNDRDNGEEYLLRLFDKVGSSVDNDLRQFLEVSVRRMRRVMASSGARDVLVEVLDVVEDATNIGSRMTDPGNPLSLRSSRIVDAERSNYLGPVGRSGFWRNIARVAEALTRCHDVGVVHGRVNETSIFRIDNDPQSYRLGGYEASLGVLDRNLVGIENSDENNVFSFRRDWIDLGAMCCRLLGLDRANKPNITSAEQRLLDRLAKPPTFELYDGGKVLDEIRGIIDELQRLRSGIEGELILYIPPRTLREQVPALTSDAIAGDDTNALINFVSVDLENRETLLAEAVTGYQARIATDTAIYDLRSTDGLIATIERCRPRRSDENVSGATTPVPRIRLARNREEAKTRLQIKGSEVASWIPSATQVKVDEIEGDSAVWHALILQEAFSLLTQQFMIFPVKVVPPSKRDERTQIVLAPRTDDALDHRRNSMGLESTTKALSRQFRYDDTKKWTLSSCNDLGKPSPPFPELQFEGSEIVDGRRVFVFQTNEQVPPHSRYYLRPLPSQENTVDVRRRIRNIVAARGNLGVLASLNDPGRIGADEMLAEIASPGCAPQSLDASKKPAWAAIGSARPTTLVVGPPGVGKTFLVTTLVEEIFKNTPDARVLISAQNHDTLANMEHQLGKYLNSERIVVRIGKNNDEDVAERMRERSKDLLKKFASNAGSTLVDSSRKNIQSNLENMEDPSDFDEMVRDTDNLILRAAHVVLASTNSYAVEEMITDGEQFDWVIIEEAAKASGPELIGPLLLGNRRLMIGDHNQLVPFGAEVREQLYESEKADLLLEDAIKRIQSIQDIPDEVHVSLSQVTASETLRRDVLSAATRLEQPFKTIVEREEERGRDDVVITLTEQSRMHPDICELVSNLFYKDVLVPARRVKERSSPLKITDDFPSSAIVVLDLPPLSKTNLRHIERNEKGSYCNDIEAAAIESALQKICPNTSDDEPPSLAILAPYSAQVQLLRRSLTKKSMEPMISLQGFASPKADCQFVYTIDGFQGGEADVIIVSLVRNNSFSGTRALGFVRNRNRLNVMLSRARHKLVIVTSLDFLADAVSSTDPDRAGATELADIGRMVDKLRRTQKDNVDDPNRAISIVRTDADGGLLL